MFILDFYEGRNNSVLTRVDGKIAFPAKNSQFIPQPGEKWICEIVGENPKGTVVFLNCLKKFERTLEVFRFLGCEEVENWYMENVAFMKDGKCLGFIPMEEVPEYREKLAEHRRKAQEQFEKEKKVVLEQAAEIRKQLKGIQRKEITLPAANYKLEVLEDEDFGLHKADEGYMIRITPLLDERTIYSKEEPIEPYFKEVFEGQYDKYTIFDMAEDEGVMYGDGIAIAKIELARELMYTEWALATIKLTDEQISEIEERYPDRENKEFLTEAKYWIKL